MRIDRRALIAGATTAAFLGPRVARAADFRLKLSLNTPIGHPVTTRSREAAEQIGKETDGRVQLDVFPSSQLGGDMDALSQLRSGALEIQAISGGVLANLIPGTNLYNVAFAFSDYDTVWKAMDGGVGAYIAETVEATGLHAHPRVWDNGFRQCTTSSSPINHPDDLKNLKFRVAPAPLLVSVFKNLGAAIATINVAEIYTALQTKVVDGQENGLTLIDTLKLFEVQRYCSLTNHMWDGFILIFNGRAWKRLPPDVQKIVSSAFDGAIDRQREDLRQLDASLQTELQKRGLALNKPDPGPFQKALQSAGFYKEWKEKFGAKAWAELEKYTGTLA
jgi:TRAP-type transport system periplasmic protein